MIQAKNGWNITVASVLCSSHLNKVIYNSNASYIQVTISYSFKFSWIVSDMHFFS